MPVMLLVQAVQDMGQVKQIGQKEQKYLKIQLTLEILGIIFAIIPFLDELTPEIAGVSAVIRFVDVAGNTGLAVQGIVANPESAGLEILGALGGVGFRNEDDFATLAAARRDITEESLAKVGTSFKKLEDGLQGVVRTCRA
jgi:glucan 1,3-beta-glucosidase